MVIGFMSYWNTDQVKTVLEISEYVVPGLVIDICIRVTSDKHCRAWMLFKCVVNKVPELSYLFYIFGFFP